MDDEKYEFRCDILTIKYESVAKHHPLDYEWMGYTDWYDGPLAGFVRIDDKIHYATLWDLESDPGYATWVFFEIPEALAKQVEVASRGEHFREMLVFSEEEELWLPVRCPVVGWGIEIW